MFNEKAEKLNGRAAMVGFVPLLDLISPLVKLSQVYGERHVTHSSISMIGGFIFAALLTDGSIDDDDDMDGGMMIPAYQPNA